MAVSFPGGKRLKSFKQLTADAPLCPLPICDEYIFPFTLNTGVPLTPLVKAGDSIKLGQKIADAEDYFAVPVHSSVSGIVSDIKNVTVSPGKTAPAIIIESDGLFSELKAQNSVSPDKYTTRELLWLIRDAGIIEPDGEPAHIKLNLPSSVKFVIANCAESDLYVTSKQKLIEARAAEIIGGLKVAMRILNVKEGYIGVEAHMKNAFYNLKKALRYDNSIHLLKLKSKYPQSDETQIIKVVTGRDTPSGSVVLDAKTLYDIYRAVNYKKSVTERIVTVSGNAVKNPSVFITPLGAPVSFLLKCGGGLTDENARIIEGGTIRGSQADICAPVTKNTSAVLALSGKDVEISEKSCGICRKCISKCPMRINPRLLSNTSDIKKAENNFILDCTECGLCSYICLKRRNPLGKICSLKKSLIKPHEKDGI